MSNNSWKQYGGIAKMEEYNVINANTIVAEQFVSRSTRPIYQFLNGTFEVSNDLSAANNIITSNSFFCFVDTTVNNNLYANQKLFFGSGTFQPISSNLSTDSSHAFMYGNSNFIGVNIQNPNAIFHVTSNVPEETNILVVESSNNYIRNILAQNKNDRGVVLDADDTSANLYFHLDSSTNRFNVSDANITYTLGGNLSTSVSNDFIVHSKFNNIRALENIHFDSSGGYVLDTSGTSTLIDRSNANMTTDISGIYKFHSFGDYLLSTSDDMNFTVLNGNINIDTNKTNYHSFVNISHTTRGISGETYDQLLTVYDVSNVQFLPNAYDISGILTGNSIVGVAKDSSSNTFIRLISANKQLGSAYGGGVFPNDTSRSISLMGVNDVCGNYLHNQMIISNNNKEKYLTTMGINTFSPKSDQYIVDLNGPIRIANGEIQTMAEINFELKSVEYSKTHPNYGIAVGTPSTLTDDATNPIYNQFSWYTNDGGINWQLSNNIYGTSDFNQTRVNFLDTFVYDSNYAFIVGEKSYIYYTNDSGKNWYRSTYGDLLFRDQMNIIGTPYGSNIRFFIPYRYNNVATSQVDTYTKQIRYFDLPVANLGTTLNGNIYSIGSSEVALDIDVTCSTSSSTKVFFAGQGIAIYLISLTEAPVYTLQTYTYHDILAVNDNLIVAVGNNVISYSNDAGLNWTTIDLLVDTSLISNLNNVNNIVLKSIFARDENIMTIVGDEGVFGFTKSGPAKENWQIVPDSILNSSGIAERINGNSNSLLDIHMTSDDAMIISNVITNSFNDENNNDNDILGLSKILHVFIPSLFNDLNNTIMDICGNINISGYLKMQAGDLTINNRLFVGQDVSFNKRLYVQERTILDEDVSMNMRLFVQKDVSLNSRFYVQDKSIFENDVSMVGRLFVNEDVSFNKRLYVSKNSIFDLDVSMNTRLFVNQDVSFNRRLFVKDNVTLPSTSRLYVNYIDGNPDGTFPNSKNLSIGENTQIINIGDVAPSNRITDNYYTNPDSSYNYINIGAVQPNVDVKPYYIQIGNYLSTIPDVSQNKIVIGGATDDIVFGGGGITIQSEAEFLVTNKVVRVNNDAPDPNESQQAGLYIYENFGAGNVDANAGFIVISDDRRGFNLKSTVENSHIITLETEDMSLNFNNPYNTEYGINDIQNGLLVLTQSSESTGGDYSITVKPIDISNILIRDSNASNQETQYILTKVAVNDDLSLNNRFFVSHDVSLNKRLYVKESTIMDEDVSMNMRLFVHKDVSLNSRFYVQDKSIFENDVSMVGRLFVNEDVSLNKRLYVQERTILDEDVSMNMRLFVQKDVSLNSRFYVQDKSMFGNDVSMIGRLFVNEDVSFNKRLYVKENSIFEGDVSVNQNVFIGKDLTIDGNLFVEQYSNETIINTTTTQYFLTIAEDMSLNGRIFVRDDASFNSRLYVQDKSIFENDVSMVGRLFVSEDVSFNSRFYVQDKSIFENDVSMVGRLFVNQDVSFNKRLYVQERTILDEDVSMNMRLFVQKDVSLNNRLYVKENSIFGNDVSMNNNLYVQDKIGINNYSPIISLDINSHDAIRIPVGTTTERGLFAHETGQIRFNTTTSQFEGYNDSGAWQGLGGVIDVDQNTFILAESAPTKDENQLRFFTADYNLDASLMKPRLQMLLDASNGGLAIGHSISADVSNNLYNPPSDGLTVLGDVSMNNSAYIANRLGISTHGAVVSLDISTNDALKLPTGIDTERPVLSTDYFEGFVRFNNNYFHDVNNGDYTYEGSYGTNEWKPLGQHWKGVIDTDGDTYITAETSYNFDNDDLKFYTSGDLRMTINQNGNMGFGTVPNDSSFNFNGTTNFTGDVEIAMDVSINETLYTKGLKISGDLSGTTLRINSLRKFGANELDTSAIIDLGNHKISYNNIANVPSSEQNIESVPVGGIIMWGDPVNIPTGFYLCDGGASHGVTEFQGIGSGMVQVPDLRSKFVIGYHDGDATFGTHGNTGGSTTISEANLPEHSHYSAVNHNVNGVDYYLGQYNSVSTHASGGNYIGVGTTSSTAYTTSTVGSSTAYYQPYYVLMFLIRYTTPLTSDVQLYGQNVYYVPNRLGIGTTSPYAELHISKDIDTGNIAKNSDWHTDLSNSQLLLSGFSGTGINQRLAIGYESVDDYAFLQAADHNSTTTAKNISMQPKGGNVGIGTTNPLGTLDVGGAVRGDFETNNIGIIVAAGPASDSVSHDFTSSTAILRITGNNATNNLQFGLGDSGYDYSPWIQASYDNSSTISQVSGSKSILLNPLGGNVGIGTTSPGEILDVNGTVQATSFNATSDARLKDNIVPLNNPLLKIVQLQGVNFTWKKEDTNNINAGLIAQDIEKVIPEVVTTQNNEMQQKSVNYNGLIPYLIESVKTLSNDKEIMQQEIDNLKNENKVMKEKMKQYDEWFAQLMNK